MTFFCLFVAFSRSKDYAKSHNLIRPSAARLENPLSNQYVTIIWSFKPLSFEILNLIAMADNSCHKNKKIVNGIFFLCH